MQIRKNLRIKGQHGKDILTDLYFKEDGLPKPVVVFCHGYKGYKDWGAWHLVAERFASRNFFFVKMNFSHNGGTPQQPIDFPDLEAFGNNNYIKELDDLDSVLSWLRKEDLMDADPEQMSLIGHSRGGGIVAIKAAEDPGIKKVISWAGVSDFASRFPSGDVLAKWEQEGVAYITNARTKQQMPHYFQFYTSFKENEGRLNIRRAVERLDIPFLTINGDRDQSVLPVEAERLHSWNRLSQLRIIENADHTFGSAQPWEFSHLPEHLEQTVHYSLDFLES